MGDLVNIYATFSSHEEAKRVARAMIERRIAASVNVLAPCTSIYRWEGEITENIEHPAIFKTTVTLKTALIAAIAESHSYKTPAIVAWADDERHPAAASWVKSETLSAPPPMRKRG